MADIKIRVPINQRKTLGVFFGLSEDQRTELIRALEGAGESSTMGELTKLVAESVNLEKSQVQELIEMLVGMQASMGRFSISAPEFVAAVGEAGDFEVDKPLQDLGTVLQCGSLASVAKARELFFDRDKVVRDTRVLTDLRPVFGESDNPVSMIITQSMRFRVLGPSGPEEFFISISTENLEILLEQLSRAQDKAKKLRELLKETSVKVVDDRDI